MLFAIIFHKVVEGRNCEFCEKPHGSALRKYCDTSGAFARSKILFFISALYHNGVAKIKDKGRFANAKGSNPSAGSKLFPVNKG